MAEIEVRMANPDDLPLLKEIRLNFDSDYVWKSQMLEDLDSYSISLQYIKLPKTIHVSFQEPDDARMEQMIMRREVLVAEYDGKVVGYLRLEQDENPNRLMLKTGGIHEDYRRRGIMKALLNVVQETAMRNHLTQLVVTVQAKNDPAIRLLTSQGFQFCGYQEFFFVNLEIALFYFKNIR